MRNYFKAYTNWRFLVLSALGTIAFILIAADAEDMSLFLLSKVFGCAIAFAAYHIGKYWYQTGKLDDLNKLLKEE